MPIIIFGACHELLSALGGTLLQAFKRSDPTETRPSLDTRINRNCLSAGKVAVIIIKLDSTPLLS